jgi:hypothetical protein
MSAPLAGRERAVSHHCVPFQPWARDVAENRNREALSRVLTRHRLRYEDDDNRSWEGSERSI